MKVLNLINARKPFVLDQIQVLEEQGINCDTICVPSETYAGEPNSTGRSPFDYLKFYPKVLSHVSSDYDVIHAHYGLTAPFALAQPNRPIVLTLWGSDLMADNVFSTLNSVWANYFDAVIIPSESMAEFLRCNYHLIPFGVDRNVFRPINRQKAREEIGWSQDKTIALFPYAPERSEKNFQLAREVVSKATPDIDLKVIHGVDHRDIPYYMNASNLLLVTSKRESGPMVVKEAAACNLPIVSTDVGFVSDVIGDVYNSYVCRSKAELVSKVEAVIKNGPRSNGRTFADDWDLEHMGQRLLEVYSEVCR